MIAAILIRSGMTLITGNTAHYARIKNLNYDLRLGNWRS
jgi:predicted nucleic acid-binding protein